MTSALSFDEVFGRYCIALVTPFSEDEEIDEQNFRRLVQYAASGGGSLIAAGTTGEQHSLSVEEKVLLYSTAVSAASVSGIRIVAGVAAVRTKDAVRLAKAAASAGCSGIMLGLPPYVRPSEEEITSYVEAVANAAPGLPILLYNNTPRNGGGASVRTISKLFSTGLIGGVKIVPSESTPAAIEALARSLHEAVAAASTKQIRLFTGSDVLFAELASASSASSSSSFNSSATSSSSSSSSSSVAIESPPIASPTSASPLWGLTSILGNVAPREAALVVRGLTDGGGAGSPIRQEALRMKERLLPLARALLAPTLPVGVKAALKVSKAASAAGLDTKGSARAPLGHLSAEGAKAIEDAVREFEAV